MPDDNNSGKNGQKPNKPPRPDHDPEALASATKADQPNAKEKGQQQQ